MKKTSESRQIQNSKLHQKLVEILQVFVDHLRAKNKSPKTINSYYQDVFEFLVWYQHHYGIKVEKVNKKIISEYIQYMSPKSEKGPVPDTAKISIWQNLFKIFNRKKGNDNNQVLKVRILSPNSRRRKLSGLSQFYSYMVAAEYFGNKLLANPVNKILHSIKLKDIDIKHTARLSKADFEILVEKNWRPREQLILHLLFLGGLRLAEVTALKASDLEAETRSIKLIRKGGSVHKLKIQDFEKIEFLWDRYLNSFEQRPVYLFSRTERAVYNIIMKCFKRAGINEKGLTPHSFRKGCASEMYHKTKDLLQVRDYLNHQDAKVTQTYIELFS